MSRAWIHVCLLTTALLVCPFARPAFAQAVETRTFKVDGPLSTGCPFATLDELDVFFLRGDVSNARTRAFQLLAGVAERLGLRPGDPAHVVWIGKSLAGVPEIHRLRLTPAGDRIYALDLLGQETIFEVFFARDKSSELFSAYKSTRVEDPLVAQLPAAAMQILTPMFGIIGATRTTMAGEPNQREPEEVWATLSRAQLPFKRATMAVTSRAVVALTQTEIQQQLVATRDQINNDSSIHSTWAHTYAAALPDRVLDALLQCGPLWQACLTAVDVAMAQEYSAVQTNCAGADKCAAEDLKAMDAVQAKFRATVKDLHTIVTADVSVANTPATHFSLGAMTAVSMKVWPSNVPRVAMDKSALAADPLGRTLTMVVVNWSPRGYDAEAYRLVSARRTQAFVGAIVTPDVGIGFGVTETIVKGFGVNAGFGWIYSKGLRSGDTIGQPPANPSQAFAVAISRTFFVGGSINFTAK